MQGSGSGDRTPAPAQSDVGLAFSWRINGQDPASTAACDEAGVEFIRMMLLDGATGTRAVSVLNWACTLGRWRSPRPELLAGTYRVYWEAVSHDGHPRSVAPGHADPTTHTVTPAPETVTLISGETHDFDATNVVTLGLHGNPTNLATGEGPLELRLRYAGADPAGAPLGCDAAGVREIQWQLAASNGLVVEEHATRETCSHYERIRWNTLLRDRYRLTVSGTDATGAIGWRGACEGLTVGAGPAATTMDCVITRAPSM